jgi:PST family polysaccharide transporter
VRLGPKRRLGNNILALGVVQVSNYILPLIILPFLTQSLGIEGFATVALVLALIQVGFVFTDYGLSVFAPYEISQKRQLTDEVNRLIGNIYGLKLIVTTIFCAILAIVMKQMLGADWLDLYGLAAVAIFAQAYQPNWLFHGIEKMNRIALIVLSSKLCYLVLILLFVRNSSDAPRVIAAWAVSQVIASVISNILVFREGFEVRKPSLTGMKTVLQNGRGYFASRISVSIFTDANVVMLGILSSPGQVALYAVCDQLYKAGKNATMPVSQALYPYMTNSRDWALFYRLLKNITIVLIIGLVFAYVGIEYILGLVFGPSFLPAVPAMQVLLIAILVNFISVLFGYPAFGALGRPDYANKTVILGAIWHLTSLACLFLVFQVDALVAASVTLSTEFLIMILRIIKLNNLKRSMSETAS